jgi:hypothetical protein
MSPWKRLDASRPANGELTIDSIDFRSSKTVGRQYYFRPVVSTAETRNELKGKSGEEAEIMDGCMLKGGS